MDLSCLKDWRGCAVSVVGSGHLRHETPLQDASAAILAPRPAAVVCDGAGSAKHSHDGANAAVRAFRIAVAAMDPFLRDCLDDPRIPGAFAESLWHYAAGWICRALVAARDEAARTGSGDPGDYLFTFAAAVVGQRRTGFVQVGDGAIAVRRAAGPCELVFAPEKGAFCNVTRFLTEKVVEEDAFQTSLAWTPDVAGVMVMSDGPEIAMVDLAANRPAPIVPQMLADFAQGKFDRGDLLGYLVSPRRWGGDPRGGDDKSVALLAPMPAVRQAKGGAR